MRAVLMPGHPERTVTATVNGGEPQAFRFDVDNPVMHVPLRFRTEAGDASAFLQLVADGAVSPKAAGAGDDARRLSFGLSAVAVRPA